MINKTCAHCGRANRVPTQHLLHRGKCGQCGTAFVAADAPIDVGQADFDQILATTQAPILVDFWAGWCAPCRMAAPEVKKTAQAMAGRALVLKVDTERDPQLAARYGVQGIPNFLVIKNGQPVRQEAGLVDHRTMIGWLETA